MTISSVVNNKNILNGLNMNSFLNTGNNITPASKKSLDQISNPVDNRLSLDGSAHDYTITIDNAKNKIIVSKRKNNGFGTSKPSDSKVYDLNEYTLIEFKNDGSQAIILKNYKNEKKPVRIFSTAEKYNQRNLYRSSEDQKDIVRAGDDNDQFRASKKLGGDIFLGGGGVDSLYLQGSESDYAYEYVDLEDYGRVLKISNQSDSSNFMYVGLDVERIRFVKGPAKKVNGQKIKLTEEQRKSEFKTVDKVNTTGNKNFDLEDPLLVDQFEVIGTQSNDTFTWSGYNQWSGADSGTLRAGTGDDTLVLGAPSDNSEYRFKFNYGRNKKILSLEVYTGASVTGFPLICYDLENIKLPNGKTVTLKQLESMLDGDGKIKQ